MNPDHLALCASDEWADAIRRWIVPWTLEGIDLGIRTVEFGPGPGATTTVLAERATSLVAVEIDPDLAARLRAKFADTSGVRVVEADATRTGMADGEFTSVVCMTMLHHVPSRDLQDALFAEAHRLLAPGGVFAGSDNLDSDEFREFHRGDVCVPVPPDTLAERLLAAGFADATVDVNEWAVRFRAFRP
ncbi:class I SAM-dependent methyltransferase [Gordonia sp. NPDC003424]